MPRKRKIEKPYPPVDLLKAIILERKLTLGVDYRDIEEAAHIAPDYLRQLVSKKHTSEWNAYTRREVCRYLGIDEDEVYRAYNIENLFKEEE